MVEECQCPIQFPMIRVSEGKYRIGETQTHIFVRVSWVQLSANISIIILHNKIKILCLTWSQLWSLDFIELFRDHNLIKMKPELESKRISEKNNLKQEKMRFILLLFQILRSHVMVRVGGGWDTLQNYLDKHDPCRCRRGEHECDGVMTSSGQS